LTEPVPDAPERDATGTPYEDDDGGPIVHTPEEAAIHAQVMARLRRLMVSYTVLKVGIMALMVAVVWRFWGPGAN
jgi:hypothetical protein